MTKFRLAVNEYLDANLGCVFHTPDFFRLHLEGRGYYFQWTRGAQVVACAHVTEQECGLWRSPAKGTFAGYAFDPELSIEDLFAFHAAVQATVVSESPFALEILPPPMAHDPVAFSRQFYLLRADDFNIARCDLNYSLNVDDYALSARMNYGNRKRLKKCQREGLSGERLSLSALPEVYETLAVNRASKGHLISMTLVQLQEMAKIFPNALVLFGVKDSSQLVASALCLRLSPSVLYVFYWGDLPGYSSYSLVVTLAELIYRYCQSEGIKLLDAGTATEDIVPNNGLIQFKHGLGFVESLKVRMKKVLADMTDTL